MDDVRKFAGSWHNQYGSEMILEVDAHGRVSGKFRTNVGRSETKELWQNTWFDLTGFVSGDSISFIVNYQATGALSAVVGRFISKEKNASTKNRIETMGYTSFNLAEPDQWRSVAVTSAVFESGSF